MLMDGAGSSMASLLPGRCRALQHPSSAISRQSMRIALKCCPGSWACLMRRLCSLKPRSGRLWTASKGRIRTSANRSRGGSFVFRQDRPPAPTMPSGAPAPPQVQARGSSQARSGWLSQPQPRSSQLAHVVAIAPAARGFSSLDIRPSPPGQR